MGCTSYRQRFLSAALFIAFFVLACANAQAAPRWTISPDGIGPLKIGMTVEQAAKAIDAQLNLTDDEISDDPDVCAQIQPAGYGGLFLLFEKRRLTSVLITKPSEVKTFQGIGIGSSETDVKAAYTNLKIEPADFEEAPALNLTLWVKEDVSGIRFKTDIQRKVWLISAGGRSIRYTEGCL